MHGGGASSAGTAVKLLGSSTSLAGSMATLDLSFSTAMAKGSGYIYITDGAVQTVIDRATGLPTIRIVGATETRKIAVGAADVQVSGNHVLVKAEGLMPGHVYSVYMGEGVLTSAAHRPFAGVTKPGTIEVSIADTMGPSVVSIELSSSVIGPDAPAGLTITFSEPVKTLPVAAISAQGGSISGLRPIGDGKVWVASVSTPGLSASSGNKLALDLAQVRDAAGNAGSGTHLSQAYVIDDGKLPTATIALADTNLTAGESVAVTVSFSEPVTGLGLGAFSAPHVTLSTPVSADGGKTWTLTMVAASSGLNHSGLQLALDMSKLTDTAGHAGSGITLSASYAVDTRSTADTVGPTIESISFDGDVLDATHELVATIRFSEAVQNEGLINALQADYASLSGLASTDGGRTWTVKLTLDEPDAEPQIGEFVVRLGQVRDLAGNAGVSYEAVPAYAVNTFSSFMFLHDDGYSDADGLVSNDHGRYFGGIMLGDFQDPATTFELKVGTEAIHNSEITFHKMGKLLYWFYGGEGSWTEGSYDIVAKALKADGSFATLTRHVDVDGTDPVIVESPASGSTPTPFDIADNLVIQFSEAVYFTESEPQIDVVTTVGSETVHTMIPVYRSYLSNGGKTLTIPSGVHHLSSGASITLTMPDTEDLAGNSLTAASISFTTVGTHADTAAPVAVAAGLAGYSVEPVTTGETAVFTITFNESVTLFGEAPRYVNMNNGGKAYLHGANTDWTELTFHYTVAAEDDDIARLGVEDLGSLAGQLKDAANNVLSNAHVELGDLYLSGYGFLEVDQTVAILAQPTIALASDTGTAGDYTSSINKPKILGSGAEAGARILIKVGAATISDYVVADSSGNWTWTPSSALAVGGHTLSFQQRDRAGNASDPKTVDITIEAFAAPQLAAASDSGSSASDGLTNIGTPTYSGIGAAANGTVALFAGHLEVGRATADSTGAWSVTVSAANALIDGSYSVTAKQLDALGEVLATSGAHTIVVDTTAPATAPGIPDLDAASDSGASTIDNITNITTPTFRGSGALANSEVALIVGSTEVGRATADASGNWSITSSALADGNHQVRVRQFDLAGNQGPDSDPLSVTIDTAGPTASTGSLNTGARKFLLPFSETIVFTPSGQFKLFKDSTERLSYMGSNNSSWSVTADGDGDLSILNFNITLEGLLKLQWTNGSVTDLAGNVAVIIGTPEWEFTVPSSA